MIEELKIELIFEVWYQLKKEGTIISDDVTTGSCIDKADAMLYKMEQVFNTHPEVKQLLKMIKGDRC